MDYPHDSRDHNSNPRQCWNSHRRPVCDDKDLVESTIYMRKPMWPQLIPKLWSETTCGESCIINPSRFPNSIEDELPLSFVPMSAVEAQTGRMNPGQIKLYREVRKGYTRFSDGDVLFAKITPSMENGKITIAKGLINGVGCGSTEFHVLRPMDSLLGKYLLHFLLQDTFRREAQRYMSGTAGQMRVPVDFLSNAAFPLPPLSEQHRIVSEIEKQFTRLDASVAGLKRAQAPPQTLPGQRPQGRLRGLARPHRDGARPSGVPRPRALRPAFGTYPDRAPRALGLAAEASR